MVASATPEASFCGGRWRRTGVFTPRAVLFWVIFFCHVQAVDPRCVYYVQNDLFLWNWRFIRDFVVASGGPTDWLGRLVLQACHFGWPGAAILAAMAGVVCVATAEFLRCLSQSVRGTIPSLSAGTVGLGSRTNGQSLGIIDELAWAFPAIVLLVVHSRYDYPLASSIGAAFAMGAAAGYAKTRLQGTLRRLAAFVLLCGAISYLAGNALYLFALCALIYECYSRLGGWMVKLGMIAGVVASKLAVNAALAAFHPGLLYFHIPNRAFFENELALDAATGVLYASFPLSALLIADRSSRAGRHSRRPGVSQSDTPQAFAKFHAEQDTRHSGLEGAADVAFGLSRRSASEHRMSLLSTILLLILAVGASQLSLRRGERAALRVHERADREDWEQVLRLARAVPPKAYSQFVRHDVNVALYQTGRLPWDMFSFPQESEPFLTPAGDDFHNLRRRRFCDFLIRLGRVNDAEFFAHEDFVRRPSAEALRLMAQIALVKERPDMARLFLNVLRDDLIYGDWAEDTLRRLRVDPTLSQDAAIAKLRAIMIRADDVHYSAPRPIPALFTLAPAEQMPPLLRSDPPNRMAFEFLMARYLVMRDVKTVAQLLPLAATFGYPATPPLYEEAALLFARIGKEPVDLSGGEVVIHGCRISRETVAKVRQLDAAALFGRADFQEISHLAGTLGLSYFRYYYRQDSGM